MPPPMSHDHLPQERPGGGATTSRNRVSDQYRAVQPD